MLLSMRKLIFALGLITLLAGALYLTKVWNVKVQARSDARLNEDLENLFSALQKYKEHVGSYPTGGNAEVAKALKGQNPKNVIILVGRKTDLNDKGEFIDPWGTPFRIYFSDNGILVRSAGPNRRFDDSTAAGCDDYFRSN
jgi:type II secretory pathway pseudopilin PulG